MEEEEDEKENENSEDLEDENSFPNNANCDKKTKSNFMSINEAKMFERKIKNRKRYTYTTRDSLYAVL